MRETRGWLRFAIIAALLPEKEIFPLLDEHEQLGKILARSLITAKGQARRNQPSADPPA